MFQIGSQNIEKESVIMSWKTVALIGTFTIALAGTPLAVERIPRPVVPTNIEVSADYKLFLVGHAIGTQNYVCTPGQTPSGYDWLFVGPQATVFVSDVDKRQILTHYQSKNLEQSGALHATWQHSGDTSAVWAKRLDGSSDSQYVRRDAIEWLLLEVTGTEVGPTGGTKLSMTKRIQRINTVGGLKPPAADCTAETVTSRRLVDYKADYYFYQ
jgi:hypothetical protein